MRGTSTTPERLILAKIFLAGYGGEAREGADPVAGRGRQHSDLGGR